MMKAPAFSQTAGRTGGLIPHKPKGACGVCPHGVQQGRRSLGLGRSGLLSVEGAGMRQPCRAVSMDSPSDVGLAPNETAVKDFKIAVYSTRQYMKPFFEEKLLGTFPGTEFFTTQLDPQTASLARGFDAVCLFVNDNCSGETIEALVAGGVKVIAMRCAGYDRVDIKAANKHGIKVVRVPTYSPESVAEHAVSLGLAINRKLHLAYNRVWQGNYTLSGLVGNEVHGKTIGVVGTGSIGTCVCSIMKGFGCNVIANDLKPDPHCVAMGVKYVSLEELLASAHVVSLHCPLLPSTFHIINRERLALMKPNAMLINVSRGGLVDTDALLEAVETGKIGGCAMDVYENEGNLFFNDFTCYTSEERVKNWDRRFAMLKSYPNVLITPHSAFLTVEALNSIANTTQENLLAFATGQPLDNEVKPM